MTQSNRVLLVDDDLELCELVQEFLKSQGFEIEAVQQGEQGVERALSGDHDIVILDIMLPKIDGLEVLRRIRAASSKPVLMLTARGDDVDRIIGLELGADDYMPKPFNPRELAARIRAILRRAVQREQSAGRYAPGEKLVVDDVELDLAARRVGCDGRVVELTGVEIDLLEVLMRSAGRVVDRRDLFRQVLDRDLVPMDRSIDMHVSHLRKKLWGENRGNERIMSVRGVGYILTRIVAES